jgi:hypothetical protein
MRYIRVKKIFTDSEMTEKQGTFFDVTITGKDSIPTEIVKEDCNIYTEEGRLLLKFRKKRISETDCDILFVNMKGAGIKTRGRAIAAGIPKEGLYSYIKSKSTGKIIHQLNSKAPSGIVGYYDNKSFFGYKNIGKKDPESGKAIESSFCRTTAYTSKYFNRFQSCVPIFKKIDSIYKKLVPFYYNKQLKAISKLDPQYIIGDTIFTTVTVNKNFRTALHKDTGDFKKGFGNLVVCSKGEYEGGYTLFPQYGIGIDCRNGDFMAMDVHQWHCNSPISGKGIRMSFVLYLREKMINLCPKN